MANEQNLIPAKKVKLETLMADLKELQIAKQDYCGVLPEQVKIVMVSNADTLYKQSPAHEEKGLNIIRVPTMIVYENNTEINRFIEYPVESLEKDLLKILKKQLYKPNYAMNAPPLKQ